MLYDAGNVCFTRALPTARQYTRVLRMSLTLIGTDRHPLMERALEKRTCSLQVDFCSHIYTAYKTLSTHSIAESHLQERAASDESMQTTRGHLAPRVDTSCGAVPNGCNSSGAPHYRTANNSSLAIKARACPFIKQAAWSVCSDDAYDRVSD